jgi:hypothetical protein
MLSRREFGIDRQWAVVSPKVGSAGPFVWLSEPASSARGTTPAHNRPAPPQPR